MSDTLTLTIKQEDENGVLSTTTVEYPNLPNELANVLNFAVTEAIVELAKGWAAIKADGGDVVVTTSPGNSGNPNKPTNVR
jgi:hypothetical protein